MVAPLSPTLRRKCGLVLPGLLFIAALSACSVTRASLNDRKPALQAMKPETVLEEMTRTDRNIFKAMANIDVYDGSGRYSTKAAILIKRPSSMRIEAIPIIGPVNFFLSIHEDILKIFFPQKGIFYVGKATSKNLANAADFFPAGLSIEDLLSVMLGTYPRVIEKDVSLAGFMEGHLYRVDTVSGNKILQSAWVDPLTRHLVGIRVFKDFGRVSYTARFTDFETSRSPAMPLKITLDTEIADNPPSTVTIRYSDIKIDADIEELAFDLQTPPGIKPVYLDRKAP
jgi:hypothetical protein